MSMFVIERDKRARARARGRARAFTYMKIMANYTRAVGFFSSDRRPDAAFSLSTRSERRSLLRQRARLNICCSLRSEAEAKAEGEGVGEGVGEGEGEARRGEGAGEAEVYGR